MHVTREMQAYTRRSTQLKRRWLQRYNIVASQDVAKEFLLFVLCLNVCTIPDVAWFWSFAVIRRGKRAGFCSVTSHGVKRRGEKRDGRTSPTGGYMEPFQGLMAANTLFPGSQRSHVFFFLVKKSCSMKFTIAGSRHQLYTERNIRWFFSSHARIDPPSRVMSAILLIINVIVRDQKRSLSEGWRAMLL